LEPLEWFQEKWKLHWALEMFTMPHQMYFSYIVYSQWQYISVYKWGLSVSNISIVIYTVTQASQKRCNGVSCAIMSGVVPCYRWFIHSRHMKSLIYNYNFTHLYSAILYRNLFQMHFTMYIHIEIQWAGDSSHAISTSTFSLVKKEPKVYSQQLWAYLRRLML